MSASTPASDLPAPTLAGRDAHVATSGVEKARVFTMTQLNQQTPQVIDEINSQPDPAFITKHGRIVAMITPLAGVDVAAYVLDHGPLTDELEAYEREHRASQADVYTSDQVRAMFKRTRSDH